LNRQLKKELKTIFSGPAPTRKQEFLNRFSYPGINRFTFFRTQAGYIRKRFWLLSLLFLSGALLILRWGILPFMGLMTISTLLPFLSLLGISEIYRSQSYHMAELEMSCKYNLGEITLARLFLIGFMHLIILLAILLFAKGSSGYGTLRTVLYLIVPSWATSGLSLLVINRLYTREVLYVCGCIAGFAVIGNSILITTGSVLYEMDFILVWVLAFVISAVLLFMEAVKLIRRTEDMQWNLSSTG
jgi:hypothetical protein